ncbi:penicillin-binding protein 1B [Denitrificimonas caeni]|uniref:Penicillin-binding protein 1B n=1 Tax=Denitrificimonas caeni TaxID=521720 RepID=A0AAE9VPZ3_9GAMM|nr:penicillin-binding protein 1B [Denitrificimonas caeni]WBE26003.1 penicillin-binding protein 1B [Denitrificimonas caeni]
MTKKTTSRPTRKAASPRKAKPSKRWLGLLFKLFIVAVVLLAGVLIYLDAVVQEKFSGKRWTVPAKVYARPLELFAGQKLNKQDFLTELNALGYRNETSASSAGAVSVNGNTVELHTRGFQFYEGAEPAQAVRVRFSGGSVASLTKANGSPLAVARLEPLLVGGLYPAHQEDRILIRLDQVPELLPQALIAVEDRDFYQHHGVSLKSIARALWVNTSSGSLRQGGSTLTQQLVKNFFLTNERTLTRKVTEALMSVLIELHYSKEEILEAYLNEVFLGQDGQRAVHGFGLASQYFFSRPLAELKLQQIALLVAMVKGPSYYNPRRQPERALERRNLVINLLAEQGIVDEQQAEQAKKTPLGITKRGSLANTTYPGFLDLVKRQLREDYRDQDLTEEGLSIFTSFDPILQRKAEESLTQTYKQLAGRKGIDEVESAVVVSNPETGEVLALLGSRQPRYAGFNRALDAVRPIGSLIKPAVYLTALEQPSQYTLTHYLQDETFSVKSRNGQVWTPQNYDRKEHGTVFLYQGLAQSYNLSTAKLGLEMGVPRVLNTVRRLGVERDWPAYPSMLLGAGSLSPIEVADMYQTIANGGFNTPLRAIRSVLNAEGEPLGRYPYSIEQRFDAGAIYLTQEAMRRVMTEGTGRSVYNRVPDSTVLAGKTGTSNDLRDSWFAGFGQDLLAVVWMGRDDNGQTPLTGASGALQVWANFMQQAAPRSLNMSPPDNIVTVWVDAYSGLGSAKDCPGAVQMPYIRGSEPLPGESCDKPTSLPAPVESVKSWIRSWLN